MELDTKLVGLQRVHDQEELHPISLWSGPSSHEQNSNSHDLLLHDDENHTQSNRVGRWLCVASIGSVVGLFLFVLILLLEDYGERAQHTHPLTLFRLSSPNSICLDGSPGAFYHSPATNNNGLHSWMIFLEGGSWCETEDSCASQSRTEYGSSYILPKMRSLGGIFSRDEKENPVFHNFHHVLVKSCDGSGFLGQREDTVSVTDGTILHFRGRLILEGIFEMLRNSKALNSARDVVVVGCGQGGLSALLLADWIPELLPETVVNFRVIVDSGFHFAHNNVLNEPVFESRAKSLLSLHNATSSLPTKCLQNHPNSPHNCVFANTVAPLVSTNVLAVSSVFDSWAIGCVLLSQTPSQDPAQADGEECWNIPGWRDCSATILNPIANCTASQMEIFSDFAQNTVDAVKTLDLSPTKGNGVFLHSCPGSCVLVSHLWLSVSVGGKSVQRAVGDWWLSTNTSFVLEHGCEGGVCVPSCQHSMQ